MTEPTASSSSKPGRPPTAGGDPLIGTRIGPFLIVRRLGEGGMGAVYLARQEKPAREVALKLMRSGPFSQSILRRFELEAEMLGRLHHPGIAQVYQAGTFETPMGTQPYFAMEYVDGKPVDVYVRLHSLNLTQRLELAARICDAVQHAHERGLVHRDLKPGNILVTADGQPKVLDFGVARATDADVQMTAHTEAGDVIGTLGYMSPEQVGGQLSELDTRSDVYALGVVLYELLTGQMPYALSSHMLHEVARIIREVEPRKLSTIDRIYRGDVETIVAKALAKEKARRYQSASALAGDIRHFLADEPISARPASALYQLAKFARRHRAACVSLVAIGLALVAGAGLATWQAVRAMAAEKEAGLQAEVARGQAQEARAQQQRAEQAAAFAQTIFGGLSPYVANGQDTSLLKVLLRQAELRIGTELRELPEVEGAMRTTLGTAYTNLGLYTEAREQLDRAAKVLEPLGADHRESRNLLAARARLQLRLGDFEQGVATLKERVERNRRELGDEDKETLEARSSYADGLMRAGRYPEGEEEARAALAVSQRVLGEQATTTLHITSTLAVLCSYRDKDAEAETLMRKVYEIERRDLGTDALATWESAGTLGMIMDRQDRAAESEPLTREVLQQLSRLLGPEHPQTLNVKNNLGVNLRNQGRHPEAETLFREVAAARTRVLKADHPDTLFAWANVADELIAQERYDEAEPIVRSVLEARRTRIGIDHPQTNHSLMALAEILRARGDYAAGAEALVEELASWRRTRKPDDVMLQIGIYNCAGALQDASDHARAEPLYREVLALHEKYGTKDQAFVAAAMNGLAKSLEAKGDRAGADQYFELGLAMRRRMFRDGNREIAYSLIDQGEALVGREDWTAAERVLRMAVANEAKMTPANPLELAKAQALLGAALLGKGDLAEAEKLLLAAEPVMAEAPRHVRPKFLQETRRRIAALFDARERVEPGKDFAGRAASWRSRADADAAK